MKLIFAACLATGFMSGTAFAGELVYTPVNPSFGGSPLNSSHLMAGANAQRQATASDANRGTSSGTSGTGSDGSSAGNADAELFVRQLQGRLLSALAGQVTEAIFGENPQDSGTVTFGSTTVTFDRSIDSIHLQIVNNLDGTVTDIIVPQLVTGSS